MPMKVKRQFLAFKMNNIRELLGFWILSIVWYSEIQNVSKTGSVSILR
jgi:hypothetical protein